MAFAFYVRALDRNPANFDGAEADKMITGLANNLPHLLPNPYIDGRKKRSALTSMGISKPPNMLASDLPVFEFDPALHEYIERYARKIACAIYYREQGRIATTDHCLWATWGLMADRNFMKSAEEFIKITPLITIGKRSNKDIRDQLIYRCNKSDTPDILAAMVGFGQGIVLQLLVMDPNAATRLDCLDKKDIQDIVPWTRVIDNYR